MFLPISKKLTFTSHQEILPPPIYYWTELILVYVLALTGWILPSRLNLKHTHRLGLLHLKKKSEQTRTPIFGEYQIPRTASTCNTAYKSQTKRPLFSSKNSKPACRTRSASEPKGYLDLYVRCMKLVPGNDTSDHSQANVTFWRVWGLSYLKIHRKLTK